MRAILRFWVPLVFLAWAAVLVSDPVPFVSPVVSGTRAPAWAIDPTPVRQPKMKPEYAAAGFTYQCMECHRIIPSPTETLRQLTQHREIQLNHGINTRCFNCHHLTNRNAFAGDAGEEIPWNEPQRLCARCHGPVYRDWQAGSHGRINGYWDSTRGPQTKRRCIECHDPHTPPFTRLQPAPGPNTLRMGNQDAPRHEGRHDPLRIFSQGNDAKPTH